MILPPKIVPYFNAAILSLEALHHMSLTYYLHSSFHYGKLFHLHFLLSLIRMCDS